MSTPKIRYNRGIRAQTIRLVDAEGKQIGVVPLNEGLKQAQDEGLDLVEVSPDSNPPVCRILDYGKYLYQESKRLKEQRKNQKIIKVKEVKFKPKIQEHDYQTKLRNCIRFLEEGNKVKLSMLFRGREQAHTDYGVKVLDRLINDLNDFGYLEKDQGLENRMMSRIIAPHPPSVMKANKLKGSHAKVEDKQNSPETV